MFSKISITLPNTPTHCGILPSEIAILRKYGSTFCNETRGFPNGLALAGNMMRFNDLSPKVNSATPGLGAVNFGDAPESVEANTESVSGEVVVAAPYQPDRTAVLPARLSVPPYLLVLAAVPHA
jgi:hypothetical protein